MDTLKQQLKELIVEECDKDFTAEDIGNNQPLVGGELDIDSLDVLQICMAIKTTFGIRIQGSAKARKILKDIDTLAEFVEANKK